MTFSIRGRLLWSLLLAIAVLTASASMVTYRRAESDVNELFDYEMKQMIYALGMHLSDHAEMAREPLLRVDHDFVTQIWSVGRLVSSSRPEAGPDAPLFPGFSVVRTARGDWRTFTAEAGGYVLQVGQPMTHRRKMAARIALNAMWPIVMIIPMSGLIIWAGIGYGLRPLRRIARQVSARDQNSLDSIPDEKLPVEVMPLVGSINALLARLGHALDAERQFIADASHELRTPATALALQMDLLEGARNAHERKEAVADMRSGIDRMRRLIEQMLMLARLEPANPTAWEDIDMARFLEEIHDTFLQAATAKSILFTISAEARPVVRGETSSLRMLLASLIDNAIRYTPTTGKVSVVLRATPADAIVEIADSGPGIPHAMREKVFSRFFRADGDNNWEGTGLGLAIARRAAERLGARVELLDGVGGKGLRTVVTMPFVPAWDTAELQSARDKAIAARHDRVGASRVGPRRSVPES